MHVCPTNVYVIFLQEKNACLATSFNANAFLNPLPNDILNRITDKLSHLEWSIHKMNLQYNG